jgi:replicative DNA helicase
MLLNRAVIEDVASLLTPDDFYRPLNGLVYGTIIDLWKSGQPADPTTVYDLLRKHDSLQASDLVEMQARVPATSNAGKYARIIQEHAARRKLVKCGSELIDMAQGVDDPIDVLDAHRAQLDTVDVPLAGDSDVIDMSDFLEMPLPELEWLIPGITGPDWRIVVVAGEGVGKSVLLRQIGTCAAYGVDPFGRIGLRYEPVRSLVVDLENPERQVHKVMAPLWRRAVELSGAGPMQRRERMYLWHRPGGIDLRKRADRAAFEKALLRARPQLVCIGPLYKATLKRPNEGWDEVAATTQRVLDDLRTRYGFALILEDHAPQEEGKRIRSIRPMGSSLWLRWPEIGIALEAADGEDPHEPRLVDVKRYRGDRLETEWPKRLQRNNKPGWRGVFAS